jgi:hypothetical protein
MFTAVLILSVGANPEPPFVVNNRVPPTFTVNQRPAAQPPKAGNGCGCPGCSCEDGGECRCIHNYGRCGCREAGFSCVRAPQPVQAPPGLPWQLAPEHSTATHDLYRAWDGKGWYQQWRPKGARAFAPAAPYCPPGQT